MNVFEVLGYGPIVHGAEELGILWTINGAYLNVWISDGNGNWQNTDCRSGHGSFYELTVAAAMDLAQQWEQELAIDSEE